MLTKKDSSKPEVRRVQGETKVHTVYILQNNRYKYALGVVEAFPAFKQQGACVPDEKANVLLDYFGDERG